jgi:hypothetical protein
VTSLGFNRAFVWFVVAEDISIIATSQLIEKPDVKPSIIYDAKLLSRHFDSSIRVGMWIGVGKGFAWNTAPL